MTNLLKLNLFLTSKTGLRLNTIRGVVISVCAFQMLLSLTDVLPPGLVYHISADTFLANMALYHALKYLFRWRLYPVLAKHRFVCKDMDIPESLPNLFDKQWYESGQHYKKFSLCASNIQSVNYVTYNTRPLIPCELCGHNINSLKYAVLATNSRIYYLHTKCFTKEIASYVVATCVTTSTQTAHFT